MVTSKYRVLALYDIWLKVILFTLKNSYRVKPREEKSKTILKPQIGGQLYFRQIILAPEHSVRLRKHKIDDFYSNFWGVGKDTLPKLKNLISENYQKICINTRRQQTCNIQKIIEFEPPDFFLLKLQYGLKYSLRTLLVNRGQYEFKILGSLFVSLWKMGTGIDYPIL